MKLNLKNIALLLLTASLLYSLFLSECGKNEIETVYRPGKADTAYIKGKDSVRVDTVFIYKKAKAEIEQRDSFTIARTSIESDSLSGTITSFVYSHGDFQPKADSVISFIDLKVKSLERIRTDTVKIFRVDTLQYTVEQKGFNGNSFLLGVVSGAAAAALTILIIQ